MAIPFTMLGAPDALACEGDACLVPAGVGETRPDASDAAAESARAVTTALDEGTSI